MAEIVKIKKDGVIQYPITKPECVIDENGKNVLQLIKENGGGSTPGLSGYLTKEEFNKASEDFATTSALDGKVDKVSGKQLSTEDFTSTLKTKLEGLNNYDDEEIQNALSSLQTQLNTLVSGNASDAINSFNEIIAFLDGVKDNEDLSSIIASIEQQIAGKMDKVELAKVATSGSYNDLSDKPAIPSEVTESTVSGWGFTKNTGTVTGVKVNGSTHNPSNGIVDLGTISADESLRIHFEPNFDLEIGQPIDVTSLIQQSMGKTPAELYEEVYTNGKETTFFISEFIGGELQEISRAIYPSYNQAVITYLLVDNSQLGPLQLIITQTQCHLVIVDFLAGYNSAVAPLAEAIDNKQDKVLKFENVLASNWVSDSTYTDYPYRCDMSCAGVTEAMYAEVTFSLEQITSENFAPICETKQDVVSIWSKENTSVTIPTIIIIV